MSTNLKTSIYITISTVVLISTSVAYYSELIQIHFNYSCILVIKEITLKMATRMAETCC